MQQNNSDNLLSYYDRFVEEYEKIRTLTAEEKERLYALATEGPFMDLRSDWALKHALSDIRVLKKLLNDMLPIKVDKVTPLPNEVDRFFEGDKDATMDVLCESEGRQFLVEMQRRKQAWFTRRMLYYGASMFHAQLKKGENYDKLCPVFVICFMDFVLPHEDDKPIYRYAMREISSGERYPVPGDNGVDLLFISLCELPRLRKQYEQLTIEEKWLYYLENMHNFAGVPEGIDEDFKPLFEVSRLNRLDEKEKFQYFRDMLTDYQKRDIGTAYFEDGLKEGLEKGLEQGHENASREIARKLLELGFPVEQIKQATGIDVSAS